MAKKKFNSWSTEGAYDVGYGRPPKSGQIKPGEVRNPWGKTGKRKRPEDLLLKVAAEQVTANINGKRVKMTQEEAAYRRLVQEFHQGKLAAMRLFMEHLSRRRPPLPEIPTLEEIQQQESEMAEREQLHEGLCDLLDEWADRKRRHGPPNMRYGPDGRPIGTIKPD